MDFLWWDWLCDNVMTQTVLVYVAGTLILLKVLSKIYRIYYPRVFAYLMYRVFSPIGERKSEKAKRKMFQDLPEVAKRLKVNDLSILEIGVGTGTNFMFYPKGTTVYPLNPNPSFNQYLEENKKVNNHVEVKPFIECYGEDMKSHVEDQSVDAVVCTLTLCSVTDTDAVLSEVKRVLKRGGKFYFMEHVATTQGTWFYSFQNAVTPFTKFFGDNCHFNRETWKAIAKAGFADVQHETRRNGIMVILCGTATK
ncbi:thiol S-methyltransferase TMT1B-like [Antedon mediterranea]|uniref:thiol S-methyltransferase TMT1B-like n=1 Tax=Antedon mediterranea TaxID=105859 RepID=UPI003AF62845